MGSVSNGIQTAVDSVNSTRAAPIKELMAEIDVDVRNSEEADSESLRKPEGGEPETDRSTQGTPAKIDSSAAEETIIRAEAPVLEAANWTEVLFALNLSGVTRTLASNCLLHLVEADRCVFKLAEHHASLWNSSHEERIGSGLSELYGRPFKVEIEVGETEVETPAQRDTRVRRETQAKAVLVMEGDKHVQQLIENFNGRIDSDSILPLKIGDF